MVLASPRLHQFLDLGGEVGADSRDVRQLAIGIAGDILQTFPDALKGAHGAVVGGGLELPLGIVLNDLDKVRDFFEDRGDLTVFHARLSKHSLPGCEF